MICHSKRHKNLCWTFWTYFAISHTTNVDGEVYLMMNLFPLVKNCTVAMTIGSDIIGYKFNNKGNKPVPGSDSIIESFSCDPLALKSGHIFINIVAYKSHLYRNWLLESLGKWKVGSNDVKSGEWWRKRVKVVVRWVVREWWQQIAMLTQPATSAMNLVILSPGCVLVIKMIMLNDAGEELLLCPREVKILKLTDSPVCPGWPRWPASQVECGVECPQLKLGNDQPSRVKSPLDQMTPPSF